MSGYIPTKKPPFLSALLLADGEASVAVDRYALRGAGIQRLRLATSGVATAAIMAKQVSKVFDNEENDLVVCLPQLRDMTAAQFAELISAHPLLASVPMLAIASDPAQVSLLYKNGFTGVILRPFNTISLVNLLHEIAEKSMAARQVLRERLQTDPAPAHNKFDRLLKEYTPPDKDLIRPDACYRYGLELFHARKLDEARPYLEKAATDAVIQGDANLALASLWKLLGDSQKTHICIQDALQGFLENQTWPKAAGLVGKMSAEYPELPGLVLREVERKAKQNQHNTVLELVGIVRNLCSREEMCETILRGAKASLTPASTVQTMQTLLAESGYEEMAAVMARNSGLKLVGGKKPLLAFLKKRRASRALSPNGVEELVSQNFLADLEDEMPSAALFGLEMASLPLKQSGGRDGKSSESWPLLGASGQVIAPLGGDDSSLSPSALGDPWTVVRGTWRILKKK